MCLLNIQKIYQKATIENSETLWCIILEVVDVKVRSIRLVHNCFSLLIVSYWKNYVTETRFSTGKKIGFLTEVSCFTMPSLFAKCLSPQIFRIVSQFMIIKEIIFAQWWTETFDFTSNMMKDWGFSLKIYYLNNYPCIWLEQYNICTQLFFHNLSEALATTEHTSLSFAAFVTPYFVMHGN